jgi:hypothetical protein
MTFDESLSLEIGDTIVYSGYRYKIAAVVLNDKRDDLSLDITDGPSAAAAYQGIPRTLIARPYPVTKP